jgi:plastocyanin
MKASPAHYSPLWLIRDFSERNLFSLGAVDEERIKNQSFIKEVFTMYRFFVSLIMIVAGIFLLAASGCKDNSSNPTGPNYNTPIANVNTNTNTIVLGNSSFSPALDTIAVNSTVTWNNTSGIAHTSTSNSGVWDTGNIPAGSTATTTFNTAGTFPYHCKYHSGMVAVIVVR